MTILASEECCDVYSDAKQELQILARPANAQKRAAGLKQQLASVLSKRLPESKSCTFDILGYYHVNWSQQQQQKKTAVICALIRLHQTRQVRESKIQGQTVGALSVKSYRSKASNKKSANAQHKTYSHDCAKTPLKTARKGAASKTSE